MQQSARTLAPLLLLLATVASAAEPQQESPEGTTIQSAEFRTQAFHGVLGDNAEGPNQHYAGYNGLWSLVPTGGTEDLIGRHLAGLNLEHYINGTDEDRQKPDILFDPRRSPMKFTKVSDSKFLLHQPPTSFYQVESWTEFTVREPNIIDMSFRCIPRKGIFPNGWLGVFWATYVEAPEEPAANFLGYQDANQDTPTWLQTDGSQMVYGREARVPLKFPGPMRDHSMASTDPRRWAEPFYYARWRDRVYLVMFDTEHDLGMYAGKVRTKKGWNPWDFQIIIHQPKVGTEYRLKVRMIFDKWQGRDWIVDQYRRWKPLTPSPKIDPVEVRESSRARGSARRCLRFASSCRSRSRRISAGDRSMAGCSRRWPKNSRLLRKRTHG